MTTATITVGDAVDVLRAMPDDSVDCCVTSPPYFNLRDYGVDGQIGLEATPEVYVERLVGVFGEVRRVLRPSGALWVNIGDSYAGSWGAQGRSGAMADRSVVQARSIASHPQGGRRTGSLDRFPGCKAKDLIGIPWMLAFALRADGWHLRSEVVWAKPNPMPESVKDRPTCAHEKVFLLSKSSRYHYDDEAARDADSGRSSGNGFAREHRLSVDGRGDDDPWQPGKGARWRNVWSITPEPCREAHHAVMPPELARRCIVAGCPRGGVVLDPFTGAGTTAAVALRLGRSFVGSEINPAYAEIARRRAAEAAGMFARVTVEGAA